MIVRYLLFLIFAIPVFAQETKTGKLQDLSLEELLNLEITTATKVSQEVSNVPATVYIITESDIRGRYYRSLLDVLADLPEIKIDYANDPRWMNDVSIRGIVGMDRFQILLNGHKISAPNNELIPIIENYPVDLAEQIEIIYGPASALYGADAFSGIINIISKKPLPGEWSVRSGFEYGSFQYLSGQIWSGYQSGALSLTVSGQVMVDQQPDLSLFYPEDFKGKNDLKTGTFNTAFGPISPLTPVSDQYSTPLQTYAFHVSGSYKDFSLTYFGNYSRTPSVTANKPNNAVYNEDQFFGHYINMIGITLPWQIGDQFRMKSSFTYSRYDLDSDSRWRNVYTNMEPAYQYSVGWMLKGEQLISTDINKDISLTGGFSVERYYSVPRGLELTTPISGDKLEGTIINSQYPNNPEGIPAQFFEIYDYNVGTFLQLQSNLTPTFKFILGTRFDHHSRYESTFNPRIGFVYNPTRKLTGKLLFGTAFLAPSTFYSHSQFGSFFSTDNGTSYQSAFFRLENPDLKPQKIKTAELNLQYLVNQKVNLSFSSFMSLAEGLFRQVSDAETINRYNGSFLGWPVDYIEVVVNQGKQMFAGGSLQLEYLSVSSGDERSSFFVNLSVVDGVVDPDGNGPQKEIQMGPISPIMVKFGQNYQNPKWSVASAIQFIGEQRTYSTYSPESKSRVTLPPYALGSVVVGYQWTDFVSSYLRITNVFDFRYRNVNLGAGATMGSQSVEFENGAPQYPIRIYFGLKYQF